MIRTQREYELAKQDLVVARRTAEHYLNSLQSEDLCQDEIEALMLPLYMHEQSLEQDLRIHEETLAGKLPAVPWDGLGYLLVLARIAHGLTQKQLADRLNVHWTQVSRDERNEYYGITRPRIEKVAEALELPLMVLPKQEYDRLRTACERLEQMEITVPSG